MSYRDSLDREMRSVLAQLELVSAIPAAQPASSAGTEHPGGRRPPGDTGHTEYARWYGPPFHQCEPTCEQHYTARNDNDRARCIEAAHNELKHLRRGEHADSATLETPDQARARMLDETEGWSPEQVETSSWSYTRFQVRRYRTIAGRDAETGREIKAPEPPVDADLAARARELADRGMSIRQIAMIVDEPKSTVHRALGKAA